MIETIINNEKYKVIKIKSPYNFYSVNTKDKTITITNVYSEKQLYDVIVRVQEQYR